MIGVVLRGLAVRRARSLLTAVAIMLGIAMISGTFVLMDGVMTAYGKIFDAAYAHTDAVVVPRTPFGATGASKPTIPASLLSRIRALPEVGRAHGYIDGHARLTDAVGTPIEKSSAQASVLGIPTGELDAMNPLSLTSGSWPSGPGQVIVDEATARAHHFRVGTEVGVVARRPVQRYRVVGVFRFADAVALGPVQFLAVDLPVAQRMFDKPAAFDEIDVAARPGVPTVALVDAIGRVAPPTARVTTASAQSRAATSDIGRQFDLMRYALLALGAITLVVSSFVIFNSLSLTVAQRTRELAVLRALGASRPQLLWSVLVEGALVGLTASLAGLGLGIGFARGLDALFASLGVRLPTGGLVLGWRTVSVSVGAGFGVTLAAVTPAVLRAMRVPPILAMRGPASRPGAAARLPAGRALLLGVGLAATVTAALATGLPTTARLVLVVGGALPLFAGVIGTTRYVVPALAAATLKPVESLTGAAGELAREDVVRDPGRTAVTATALTVGVAVLTFVAVLAQGLRQATGNSIRQQVSADRVITAQQDLLPPDVQRALRARGVVSAGVRTGTVHALGSTETMTGVVPADIAHFWHFTWTDGSGPASLAALRRQRTAVLLASDFAGAHRLALGSTLSAETTAGVTLHLAVAGIYRAPKLSPLLGAMTVGTDVFDRSFTTPGDSEVYVDLTGAIGPGSQAVLADVLDRFTVARAHTLDGFITARQATIGTLLDLFSLLLALCVVVSVLGIVNTLTLSVIERTREIGMLRAIGMTRSQVRGMIHLESQVIALIGALIGLLLGLLLAALTTGVLSSWNVGFSLSWAALGVVVAAAFLTGALAGIEPARRAARLDPLTAIAYE